MKRLFSLIFALALVVPFIGCSSMNQLVRQRVVRPSMTVWWKSGTLTGTTSTWGGHITTQGRTTVSLELIPDGGQNIGRIELEYDGRHVRTLRTAPYKATVSRLNGLRPLIIRVDYEDFYGAATNSATYMVTINAQK